MWTIVRFGLLRDPDYRRAFDLLAHAGFQPHRTPAATEREPFPGAVVADLFQDPAVVSRAVFEALHDAGLRPMGVSAAHVGMARRLARTTATPRQRGAGEVVREGRAVAGKPPTRCLS